MTFEIDAKRGVASHYGVRTTNGKFGGQQNSSTILKSAIWDFSYDDLPAAGTNGLQFVIPANATIVSAVLYVDVAFTSTSTTTDLAIGLATSAGAEIDLDGLLTAANSSQTTIAVENSTITGSGALVGKGIGAAAGELVVTPTANDLLTGKGRIVVQYVYNK
ncbi:hypothetical protein UFOVP454_26 [uncultured Caudovirales phage]|uniref:Uncharacterized protein n=1 Tax=uncultured Caudovirales phage TaxID=2100421 RepID=A0A6J5MGR3_9CAUD|nr:hypothetical protein UFOVP454_26 [uncultured Caudovirales phage]